MNGPIIVSIIHNSSCQVMLRKSGLQTLQVSLSLIRLSALLWVFWHNGPLRACNPGAPIKKRTLTQVCLWSYQDTFPSDHFLWQGKGASYDVRQITRKKRSMELNPFEKSYAEVFQRSNQLLFYAEGNIYYSVFHNIFFSGAGFWMWIRGRSRKWSSTWCFAWTSWTAVTAPSMCWLTSVKSCSPAGSSSLLSCCHLNLMLNQVGM